MSVDLRVMSRRFKDWLLVGSIAFTPTLIVVYLIIER